LSCLAFCFRIAAIRPSIVASQIAKKRAIAASEAISRGGTFIHASRKLVASNTVFGRTLPVTAAGDTRFVVAVVVASVSALGSVFAAEIGIGRPVGSNEGRKTKEQDTAAHEKSSESVA
jgi:hypothetical protein